MKLAAKIVLAMSFTSAIAFAGKLEREKQKEITPKITEGRAAVKRACGCDPAINVKWDSYKTPDDMFRIPESVAGFSTAATSFCTDAESKKAFCANVSSLNISFNADGGSLTKSGKSFNAGSNGSGYSSDNLFTDFFNKF